MLKHGGRVTIQDFCDFELEFRQITQDLGNLSADECHRQLLSKLPQHMTTWVVEEETRQKLTQPQISMMTPNDFTAEEISVSVKKMIGTSPSVTEKVRPKECLMSFQNFAVAKKLLELQGTLIKGTQERLNLKEATQQMTVDQIFDFIRHRLEGRDKTDQYCRNSGSTDGWRSQTRDLRYVRIAEADREPDEQEKDRGGAKAGIDPAASPPGDRMMPEREPANHKHNLLPIKLHHCHRDPLPPLHLLEMGRIGKIIGQKVPRKINRREGEGGGFLAKARGIGFQQIKANHGVDEDPKQGVRDSNHGIRGGKEMANGGWGSIIKNTL